jgi:hypothetical protein
MMLLESHVIVHGSPWVVGLEFSHLSIFFIVRAGVGPANWN